MLSTGEYDHIARGPETQRQSGTTKPDPYGLGFVTAFLGYPDAGAIAIPSYNPPLNRSQLRLTEQTDINVITTQCSLLKSFGRQA